MQIKTVINFLAVINVNAAILFYLLLLLFEILNFILYTNFCFINIEYVKNMKLHFHLTSFFPKFYFIQIKKVIYFFY